MTRPPRYDGRQPAPPGKDFADGKGAVAEDAGGGDQPPGVKSWRAWPPGTWKNAPRKSWGNATA